MKRGKEKQLTISRWTKATFYGWLLGVALILILSSFLDIFGIENLQFYLGVGMAAGVSFTQWLKLKEENNIHLNWIWLSILGMGIPFLFIDFLLPGSSSTKLLLSISSGSLTTGLLQFQLLKKQFIKSGRWVIGSFLGWTPAVLTVTLINYSMPLQGGMLSNWMLALVNLFLILAGGLVLGYITGFTLLKTGIKKKIE